MVSFAKSIVEIWYGERQRLCRQADLHLTEKEANLYHGRGNFLGTVLLNHDFRTIVNEAATASPVQPIINMGQGFL